MRETARERLYEAAGKGTLEDVKAAFGACTDDERKESGDVALWYAVQNPGPDALEMVKLFVSLGVQPNSYALRYAARNTGPHALEIVKLFVRLGVQPDSDALRYAATNTGPDALEMVGLFIGCGLRPDSDALWWAARNTGNPTIVDHLLSRDDFLLSSLMPRSRYLSADTYKTYREKMTTLVSERIDKNGIQYVKTVAADIEKILKTEKPKPTKEDVKALGPIAKKISSRDWVNDARVTSSDFDYALNEMER